MEFQGNQRPGAMEMPDAIDPISVQAGASAGVTRPTQRVVPADGVVQLPAGTRLDTIALAGNDLIVTLPDGQQLLIVDGALRIPQIRIGTINVPAPAIAALIAGQEPEPAAGAPQSSGGNFAQTPGDIGDPFGLGDLLPPTDFGFAGTEQREIFPLGVLDDEEEDTQPGIVITTPDQPTGAVSATATVAEAALPARGDEPAGSDPQSAAEAVAGVIQISAQDQPVLVTVNGVTITAAGQTITTPLGLLTITSVAPDAIGYNYTLTDNSLNPAASDVVTIIVTDSDGDQATATLTLTLAEDAPTARPDVDDVAQGSFAPQTGNVITGAGTSSGAAGADTPGADGALVTGIRAGAAASFSGIGAPVAGQFGQLLMNADGSYSYVRNAGSPGGVEDSFTYQLTDGDGDQSSATLTIAIEDAGVDVTVPDAGGDGALVDEAGLDERNGEAPGSRAGDGSDVSMGTIGFAAPDGPATVTINGVQVVEDGQVIPLPTGLLYIIAIRDGVIDYAFALTDNVSGDPASQSIVVSVTDQDGDTATGSFVITILDDAPTASDDSDSIAQGSTDPATGNVITDAENDGGADIEGADGARVTGVSGAGGMVAAGVAVAGLYGVLTLNAEGSYSYVRNVGSPGGVEDSFTYQLTDGDGDKSSATLTIVIEDGRVVVTVPDAGGDGASVDEAGLPQGSAPASGTATTSGVIRISTQDGSGPVLIGGVEATAVGQTIAGSYGTLTITSIDATAIGYSYTLTGATSGDDVTDLFDIVATDQDGDTASATLTIAIADDQPTATDDVDGVQADAASAADGNVLTGAGGVDANATDGVADIAGADGASVTAIGFAGQSEAVGGAIAGAYGTLEIGSDGRYRYVVDAGHPDVRGLDADDSLSEVFDYVITDADGDEAGATLTIVITGSNDGIILTGLSADGPEAVVSEASLSDGSAPDSFALVQTGSFSFEAADGVAAITIAGQPLFNGGIVPGLAITTALGVLTITDFTPDYDAAGDMIGGTIRYSYELTDNSLLHTGVRDGALMESFALSVTDSDGSTALSSIDVQILDDGPTARAAPSITVAEDGAPISGNLLANDTAGADGARVSGVTISGVSVAIAPMGVTTYSNALGTYSFQADGAWTFDPVTQTSMFPVAADFTYTITDGDGDQSSAIQQIRLTDGAGPTVSAPITLSLDDQRLESGSTPSLIQPVSSSGTISFTAGSDAIVAIGFGDLSMLDGGLDWAMEAPDRIVGSNTDGDAVVVLTLSLSNADATVTATLLRNYGLHPDATADDSVDIGSIEVVATDADGDSVASTASLSISDDVPAISAAGSAAGMLSVDESDLTTDATADLSALFNVVLGADQAGYHIDYGFEVTTASGLIDVETGSKIILQAIGNVVEGRLQSAPGTVAFRLSVDANGRATLDQLRAVQHPDASNPDDSISLPATLIRLTATVIDGDGDRASAVAAVGNALIFRDDGPAIVAANVDGNTILLTTQDGDTRGAAFDVASANLSAAFSTASVDFGADGLGNAGLATWSYALALGPAAGSTGLASNGVPVTLSFQSGTVVGSAGGATIFSVAVDAATGIVTLTQFAEIDHPLPGSATDYTAQIVALANGLVELRGTATIVDGDGDTASSTIAVDLGGNIRFADDGPSIAAGGGAAADLIVDESDFTANAIVDLSSLFAANTDFGADGAGGVSYELGVSAGPSGLIDSLSGEAVILSLSGGVVMGRTSSQEVFRISVGPGGIVTFDQSRAVLHSPDAGPDQTLFLSGSNLITLTAIVTDGDGDMARATSDISGRFAIRDDAPAAVADEDNVARDGQTFADGNVLTGIGGSDANGTDGFADQSGADGHLRVVGLAFGAVDGVLGAALAGAYGAITLSADGRYRYDLDPADPAIIALGAGETLVEIFRYTVVDADGDRADATISITITGANDFPIARADTNWVLDGPSGSDPVATGNVLQDIAHPGAPSGLFADVADNDPDLETIIVTSAGTYVGLYGTLTLLADGSYTYALDEDKAAVNALGAGQTLTDLFPYTISDGALSVASTLTVTVFGTNDAPVIGTATARLSEEGLPGGLPDTAPDATLDTTNSVTVSGVLAIGDADAGQTLSATLGDPGAVLTAGGLPVTWTGVGTATLIGSAGGAEVIRVTLAPDGAYTVTLSRAVDHPTVALEDLKSFAVPVSVSDGTTTTTSPSAIQIVIEDDAPIATGETGATSQPAQDVNTLFILDFSDSIDNAELNIMIGAVQGALAQLDAAASGDLTIRFVIFSSGSFASPAFADAASANAYLDSLNPLAGGDRPSAEDIGLNTNYTGAIQTALAHYSAIDGASNQVFFLSDGNPNQSVQFGGMPPSVVNSLTNATASAWNAFVDGNGVNVTAIGIDNNPLQPLNIQRLRDVDLNAAPDNEPILVDDFQDLVTTLLSVIVPSAVSGDLDANDAFGADGGRLLSITVGTTTYSWDGGSTISLSDGGTISGTTLNAVATPMGGTLTLNFASGQYSYQPPSPITVTATEVFAYVVTDRDGDTASASLSVTISALAPPIAVDLDGDGVEFVSSAAGVRFDYDGDGVAETTAWVGRDDGLIAIDRNGDGKVNDGSEIVFGGKGLSDLQGLAATFDSNGDGRLDAADAQFARFGVWQDANGNGASDPGEFRSLIDAGIMRIALLSDGKAYGAANGEVQVRGEAIYTRADGSSGKIADAAFATNFATQAMEQQRTAVGVGSLSTAMLVAGLVAATPLAAEPVQGPPVADMGPSTIAPMPASDTPVQDAPSSTARTAPDDTDLARHDTGPAESQSRLADTDDRADEARIDRIEMADAEPVSLDLPEPVEAEAPPAPPAEIGHGVEQQMPLPAIAAAEPDATDDQPAVEPLATLVDSALEGPAVDLDALLGAAPGEPQALPQLAALPGTPDALAGDAMAAGGSLFLTAMAEQHAAVQLEQAAAAGQA